MFNVYQIITHELHILVCSQTQYIHYICYRHTDDSSAGPKHAAAHR